MRGAAFELLVDSVDLLLEERSDVVRRIHRQQLREALPGERQLAAARGGRRAEEQPLARVGIEGERLLDEPSGTAIELRFVAERESLGLTDERVRIPATGKPIRTLEGAQRPRVLLQSHVGAAQHQPAVEVLRVALELAREARDHALGSVGRARSRPRPVAQYCVQHRRADHEHARRDERGPGRGRKLGWKALQQRYHHDTDACDDQCRGQHDKSNHQERASSSRGSLSWETSAERCCTMRTNTSAPMRSSTPGAIHNQALRALKRGRNRMKSP